MKNRGAWLVVALLALGLGAGIAVPRVRQWLSAPAAGHCPICLRHAHKESLVKFKAEGERVTEACCLSCALTYGRQTHKPVTIVSVTDHSSGKELNPDTATFVVGSDVSPCTHMMMHVGPEKEAYSVRWDRCLPSILAFPSAESAEGFRTQHGGRLRTLHELTQQAAASDAPLQ